MKIKYELCKFFGISDNQFKNIYEQYVKDNTIINVYRQKYIKVLEQTTHFFVFPVAIVA